MYLFIPSSCSLRVVLPQCDIWVLRLHVISESWVEQRETINDRRLAPWAWLNWIAVSQIAIFSVPWEPTYEMVEGKACNGAKKTGWRNPCQRKRCFHKSILLLWNHTTYFEAFPVIPWQRLHNLVWTWTLHCFVSNLTPILWNGITTDLFKYTY